MTERDEVERAYDVAIERAMQANDTALAHEMSIARDQYTRLYKTTPALLDLKETQR